MKLTGDYVFEASPREVWDALFDPEVLAAAMPGCEKLALIDGQLHGDLNVKVGPISGKFTGKVQLVDQLPPVSYRMIIDGKGPHGFVKASATIALAAEGATTRMRYDADAQVGGKIATVGQRLIETSAKAITKHSLEGLHANIKIRAAAHRANAVEQVAHTALPSLTVVPVSVSVPVPVSVSGPVSVPEPEPVRDPVSDVISASGPVPHPISESVTVPEQLPGRTRHPAPPAASAPAPPAASAPTPSPPKPAPAIQPHYQRADAGAIAGEVTKAVARTMLPWILVVLLSIALVVSLATR